MRLISICPSNTELVGYLGLTDQLIAVDDFSDWPASVHQLPRLGSDLAIDIDKLESLQPDLVLASLSVPGMEKNVEALQERNIPHIVLNPQSVHDVAEQLVTVGKLCHVEKHAVKIYESYVQFIDQLRELAKNVETVPELYWEWWPKPIFTPGQINWLTEISEIAGGKNVFRDVELASVQTDWDDVYKRNPSHILLAWVGVPPEKVSTSVVLKRPNWTELDAVKNEQIHILSESLYCRPSPRLLEGAYELAKMLHPTVFEHVTLPEWIITPSQS